MMQNEVIIDIENPQKSNDLISRKKVLNYIHRILNQGTGKKKSFEFIQKYVTNMPSVNPQEPKTGHWILADEQNKEDVENDNYRFICSECQYSDIHAKGAIVPYCWKCGAKMN